MTDFGLWIVQELDRRGWSRSEAARRGGISASIIDKVIGGHSNPGEKLCRGLARAFGMPAEEVMRRAGLLPSGGEILPQLRALNERLLQLSEEDRSAALGVLEYALKLFEGRSDRPRRGPAADR